MEKHLQVEIVQKSESCLTKDKILRIVVPYLKEQSSLTPGTVLNGTVFKDNPDFKHISSITLCDNVNSTNLENAEYFVYKLDKISCNVDNMCGDNQEEDLPAANHWQLPSEDFFGLWESLVYDTNVKEDTLNFVKTTLLFSDRGVNPNIINWNRVILLHGPPGTGKTSLCKALAQKLSIRLNMRYPTAQLVEINSHSLFSKWFSESGKLVMKLFGKIKEIVEDPDMLVCVLIDEIESLAHARKAALSGVEPSDSIRVVNAILTQLDQIRKYPNVLILTTSNMSEAIDLAFVDRADIKQYIGPPSVRAIYQIYCTCIEELMTAGIITPKEDIVPFKVLQDSMDSNMSCDNLSLELYNLAMASAGLSGRTLRKIPFLAHALFSSFTELSLAAFLANMVLAVNKHLDDSEVFARGVADMKIR